MNSRHNFLYLGHQLQQVAHQAYHSVGQREQLAARQIFEGQKHLITVFSIKVWSIIDYRLRRNQGRAAS